MIQNKFTCETYIMYYPVSKTSLVRILCFMKAESV